MHISIPIADYPCEFIEVQPVNPLISKCQIKVCYVSDKPNRNGTVITKEVAKEIANSLPGSPIVGYYNENSKDFEEHNRIIEISEGAFKVKDTTKPYGFVDLNAKVWFQKFKDDNEVEREYLVTEGWLWTGQYPECQRVITQGNNQSMELDEQHLSGFWAEDPKDYSQFFIINEAIISKLCILGVDFEPCFEGAQITNFSLSYDDKFKKDLYSMMQELSTLLKKQEGGKMQVKFHNVQVGDELWSALYSFLGKNYSIVNICEEEDNEAALYAIVLNKEANQYSRLPFTYSEGVLQANIEDITECEYEAPETIQFSLEDVENFELSLSKEAQYVLDEIPEYIELKNKFNNLSQEYSTLKNTLDQVNEELTTTQEKLKGLEEYKLKIEKAEKEKLIESFYMLSDEDKKDVIDNINKYSLDEIESKLSVICVRNKVSFEDPNSSKSGVNFNLNGSYRNNDNSGIPAWVQAVLDYQNN